MDKVDVAVDIGVFFCWFVGGFTFSCYLILYSCNCWWVLQTVMLLVTCIMLISLSCSWRDSYPHILVDRCFNIFMLVYALSFLVVL